MGLKPLTLQMIPWCFHVAGATCDASSTHGAGATDLDASCSAAGPHQKKACVRLVGPDGSIRFLNRRVTAGDLMAAHPLHLLCRSDALVIGLPVPALDRADRLLLGRTYFLLPAHLFRSALSFSSLAACLGGLKRAPGGGVAQAQAQAPLPRPIEIQRTPSGRLQVRLCEEYLERLGRAEEEEAAAARRGRRVCTTEELAKDYKQLVRCRSWKPKLEPIKESERRRRSPRAAFGGIARRKKATAAAQLKNPNHNKKKQDKR